MNDHEKWMQLALKEAQQAYDREEVPVGAIIVRAGAIIGRGFNQTESLKDPTAMPKSWQLLPLPTPLRIGV